MKQAGSNCNSSRLWRSREERARVSELASWAENRKEKEGGGSTQAPDIRTAAASASMGVAAAIQTAPPLSTHVVNGKWTAIYGSFRQPHIYTLTQQ